MLSESSPYTDIISAASADADGSYVQLIASTSVDYKWMIVAAMTGQQSVTGLMDLSLGSSGNEVEFMSDHLLHVHAGTLPRKLSTLFYFPVDIPSGSEVRGRIQDTSTSAITWSTKVMFSNISPPNGTPTKMDTSSKVAVITGGSADVYGSYVNLITSAAHAGKWLLIGVGSDQGLVGFNELEFSIGVGNPPTGTDEIDEFGEIHARGAGGARAFTTNSMLLPVDFSQGDQLQIRAKDQDNGANTLQFSVNLLG